MKKIFVLAVVSFSFSFMAFADPFLPGRQAAEGVGPSDAMPDAWDKIEQRKAVEAALNSQHSAGGKPVNGSNGGAGSGCDKCDASDAELRAAVTNPGVVTDGSGNPVTDGTGNKVKVGK